MTAEAPVIHFENVSKWYGDVIGVNQVSLSVQSGVTGLLGPNGAGKSTLLKLITGQLRPGSGRIMVAGMQPWGNPHVFRSVGFCPDTEANYDQLSGLEFVTLMGRLSSLNAGESRRRAIEQLKRVGMEGAMKRLIKGYSKGMRQRTKLAAALIHDPRILVLDEPLNGLDPVGRKEFMDLFREFGREGRTLFVSSHILHEVESLTKHVVLIHHGRVIAEGHIEEIRALIENQPLTLEIATAAPRRVAQHLAALDGVTSLSMESDGKLVVRSRAPERVYDQLQQGVLGNEYAVDQLRALDDNLDAVFQYLVKD